VIGTDGDPYLTVTQEEIERTCRAEAAKLGYDSVAAAAEAGFRECTCGCTIRMLYHATFLLPDDHPYRVALRGPE